MLPDFKNICILQYFYEKNKSIILKEFFQKKFKILKKKFYFLFFFVKMWQPLSEASKTFQFAKGKGKDRSNKCVKRSEL